MDGNVLNKLKILAESAKYDVSCSSSGTVRSNKEGMVGNTVGGWGICHSFAGGRALYFIAEGDADKLLYIRLCLLYQPSQ